MALSESAEALLQELTEATDAWADKELARYTRRANLLRRLNTRIDDFVRPTEVSQVRATITEIDALLSS